MNKTKIIFIFCTTVLILGILIWGSANKKNAADRFDDFAKCLATKNITMYGAAWCAHCENQKNLFGDSFKYVPYIECSDEPQKCVEAGITGTPTWIFPDGQRLVGYQTLEQLAKASGCSFPQ